MPQATRNCANGSSRSCRSASQKEPQCLADLGAETEHKAGEKCRADGLRRMAIGEIADISPEDFTNDGGDAGLQVSARALLHSGKDQLPDHDGDGTESNRGSRCRERGE